MTRGSPALKARGFPPIFYFLRKSVPLRPLARRFAVLRDSDNRVVSRLLKYVLDCENRFEECVMAYGSSIFEGADRVMATLIAGPCNELGTRAGEGLA